MNTCLLIGYELAPDDVIRGRSKIHVAFRQIPTVGYDTKDPIKLKNRKISFKLRKLSATS